MNQTRRVLIVSYFFPPAPTVAALRIARCWEQLPEFGWEPHVLTVKPAQDAAGLAMPGVNRTDYYSLFKHRGRRQPAGTAAPVARESLREAALRSQLAKKAYFLLRHLLPMSSVRMPDATLGWYPYAVRAGEAMLRNQRFDAIWSSSGPPTSHIIAARLQGLSGVPWIADYRDLWSASYTDPRVAAFDRVEAQLERHVLRRAKAVTTVSEGLARYLRALHRLPTFVIYNGYDGENSPQVAPDNEFSICYAGSLYPHAQDVEPFFRTLRNLRERLPEFRVRVQFFGPELTWLNSIIDRHGLTGVVDCHPSQSHETVLLTQQMSAVLLLLGWRHSLGQPGVLPVKMFEYMSTGRPILEVGPPDSESAAILRRCNAGVTVQTPEEIEQVLMAWWSEHRKSGRLSWSPDWSEVRRFRRRTQTEELARVLDGAQAAWGDHSNGGRA